MIQGLSGQQSILAWSIAAIGVAFAAALGLNSGKLAHADSIRAAVFGIAIPLVAFGASVAWLGEIFRMERDAHYLRLMERSTWSADRQSSEYVNEDWIKDTPLLYNSWVAHSEPPARNRVLGYAGGLTIYIGAFGLSLSLAVLLLDHQRRWAVPAALFAFIVYFALTTIQAKRILNYSRLSPQSAGRRLMSTRVE